VSSDPKWAADGAVSSEPHTDPFPVITDDMLPPLANPRVPTLDDRTLAQLLAELEGEENVPPDADPWLDPLDPVDALERPRPKGPVLALGGPPALPPGPRTESPAIPAGSSPPAPTAPEPIPPLPTQQSQPQQSGRQQTQTQSPPVRPNAARPVAEPAPRSRYGEYRPPITAAHDEVPSLIGLTRRSQSKLGSRLFTVAFVAIFVLILIQTIASVVSAGH
jgi:hypothetical protein